MENTIRNVPKEHCTGCGACYNKCPINAIKMKYDEEGFIFPEVTEACIKCGQCYAVCPVIHPLPLHPTPPSYAVWASDDIRLKSSSGGMFSLLAEYVLENKGAVCGAAYTENYQLVHHIWAETKQELIPLRGSKYVQSETEMTYKEAKAYLEQGRMVLYTGCPCQIAGLYNYLGKDYSNLYTADLVCHGSNSVKAYQSFVEEFSEGHEIEKVDFRDKKYYDWSSPTVIYLKNGDVKKAAWNEGTWYKGFLEGVINRNNCYSCVYARTERIADITLADCWQIHRYNSSFDDRKGTSLVLVNSSKGNFLFEKVRRNMQLCEAIPLEAVTPYNGHLRCPTPMHPSRKFFFSHLEKDGYHKALWYGRGMRFDVGLVGWWFASNYGSSLTYYALGKILENRGKQVLMIPIAKINGTPWEKEIDFTVKFLEKHFHIGKSRPYDKMHEFNDFCDSFMLGSDQMWTGETTKLVGYTFFLDFVDKQKKKIAFATSFGHDDFYADRDTMMTASDYLKRFDAISVREKKGAEICKKRFNVLATPVLDPVFLCGIEEYDCLVKGIDEKINEKYLLCYILDPNSEKEAAAKKIAERQNLKILTILGLKEYEDAKMKWHTGEILPRITAEQFIYYIKNCSYLLTDSHHGTCFGIIYKKQYAALVNANRGATRFEAVADALDLRNRLFWSASEIENSERTFAPIDYVHVAQCVEKEKVRALEWLDHALNCPTKQSEDTINTIKVDFERKIVGSSQHIHELEAKINMMEKKHEELIRENQRLKEGGLKNSKKINRERVKKIIKRIVIKIRKCYEK